MPYINNAQELATTMGNLVDAQTAKIAVVRPTSHFEIVTDDNPDMQRTLQAQDAFVAAKLQNILTPQTDAERAASVVHFKHEFQKSISLKAESEQTNFLLTMKNLGVQMREILEDKGHLESGNYDYFTDQIFATDTGQYYDDNGQLTFIPANFKNKQRQGEERLAIAQAFNLGAVVKPLITSEGEHLIFEGGDIRQMPGKKLFFMGQGHRSDARTGKAIAEATGYHVVPIQLKQPQFYHLDCCFLPLPQNSAVIYEGEYELNDQGQPLLNANGWPKIIAGTETMTPESRELIRTVYKNDKLVLINKSEALAFATNAALLESSIDNRFKLFVNGDRTKPIDNETNSIQANQISYTTEHIQHILRATEDKMDIVEVPYSTMHGSGGSVRCTVQEVACTKAAMFPHKENDKYFSTTVMSMEQQLDKQRKVEQYGRMFTQPPSNSSVLSSQVSSVKTYC